MPGFDDALASHPTFPALLHRLVSTAGATPHLDGPTREAIERRIPALLEGRPLPHAAGAHEPSVALAEQLILDVHALDPATVVAVRDDSGDAGVVAAASIAALAAAVTRARIVLGGS